MANNNKWIVTIAVMIILILAMVDTCKGQVGLNGAGFFENRTELSDAWLLEETQGNQWVLRLPGGAITKYANATPFRGGWGLDSAIVDSITFLYKSFEEEQSNDILAKWYRKTAQQPMTSYLYDLIDLNDKFDNLKIIWAVNIYIPAEEAIKPIEFMVMNGIDIIAVELGNESYSQVGHDFEEYVCKSEPIAAMVRNLGITVIHPAAPSGLRSRKDHEQWNESLKDYLENYPKDGVVFHPYFDDREFSGLTAPVDTLLALSQIASFDWGSFFVGLVNEFPDASMHLITETNSQPSNLIGDTYLNGVLIDSILSASVRSFDWVCLHNGVAPDKYGVIYGKEGEQKKNTSLSVWGEAVRKKKVVVVDPICNRCKKIVYKLFNWRRCSSCNN